MTFEFLTPEHILPEGWLKRQLEQQALGLNGQLDKVWKDIYDSKWLGGNSDGWERFPYFLDGYIPLAFLLRDEEKIARAKKYVNALISCQGEDGGFYPCNEEGKVGDIWSIYLILKVLTVYADCAKDESVEENIARGLQFINKYIGHHPPHEWAAARWFECIIPILWLYRRRKEDWLVRLAKRLKTHGLDYEAAIELWNEPHNEWTFETHAVNIAMALKSEVVYCELTGEEPTGLAARMLNKLFEKHGTAYSHFTGDECLSGTSPSQGSELCGVVEAMYSYEWLFALTGERKWGDFLETLAFNALPAAVSADMWTHQYDQQVNQIACTDFEKPIFRTNGPQSNMFGLEPHFGCCTANFGQGWPKLTLSAYMRKQNKLVILSPLPAKIKFDGRNEIECLSEYPFRASFTLRAKRDTETLIRIPAWTKPECSAPYSVENGFLSVTLRAGEDVRVTFPMQAQLCARPERRMCLKYGALLFALPVEGKRTMLEYTLDGVKREYPYCDYKIEPTGEWRYAFASEMFTVNEAEYGLPFDRSHPPIFITAQLAPVEWDYEEGHDFVAATKVGTKRRGENVSIKLQPYGATDLRITEMALIK